MGMFDNQDLGTPFGDKFREGEAFTLTDIALGPVIPTAYGPGQLVFLTIEGERYSIFGEGIANQARSMAPDDLPCLVMLSQRATKKSGNLVKLLVPVENGD